MSFAHRFTLACAALAAAFAWQAAAVSAQPAAGQKPKAGAAPTRPAGESDADALMRARVLDVLRRTAGESKDWADASAASSVQARAADLMWEADPAAGRDTLLLAWETAGKVAEPKRERGSYRNYSKRTAARRGVLMVARRRDQTLAEKWVEEMAREKEAEGDGAGRGLFDDRSERSAVLLQMALGVVKDDPRAAADMATESLRDGISFGLQSVLVALQEQSFELAERVFRAALARLSSAGMSDPNELMILASYLYTPGRIGAANADGDPGRRNIAVSRTAATVTPAAKHNPALAADFLSIAADLLLNAPPPSSTPNPQQAARSQIGVIQSLLRHIERASPEKGALLAARVQALSAEAQFSESPSSLPDGHVEPLRGETAGEYNERRVDLLEKQAELETSPLARDLALARAAAATDPEAYERGWQVAGKIKDKELRADVTNWLTYRATLALLKRNETARARALAARNEDLAQRAVCLVVGAQRLSEAKDHAGAGEWLREAAALMKKSPPDEHWTKIALGVVAAYGKFDRAAALDALGEAVRVLNQFPTDASREETAPAVQRFTGVVTSDLTTGTRGFSLSAAVAVFRPQDFESVYGLLRGVEKPEARGEALIALCQQFLKPAPARPEDKRPKASS